MKTEEKIELLKRLYNQFPGRNSEDVKCGYALAMIPTLAWVENYMGPDDLWTSLPPVEEAKTVGDWLALCRVRAGLTP